MGLPEWCHTLQAEVFEWLMGLQVPGRPGRFKFCREGNLIPPGDNSGLDSSALALKICFMLDMLDNISASDLEQWVTFIQSFQKREERLGIFKNKRQTGFFVDPVFFKHADGSFRKDIKTRRAVTRQACAALMCAGRGPLYPVEGIPANEEEVVEFLSNLDWRKDPWGAGSHASHLVFFLQMNRDFFDRQDAFRRLIPPIFDWLDKIRNSTTGSWYLGSPPAYQQMNAAMKILTAYAVLDRPVESPELLIDSALRMVNDEHGCNNADILFVLHYCGKLTDYRKQEIQKFCEQRLDIIKDFRKLDGGFSFFREHSQKFIYQVQVAHGNKESDIQGTILFLWSLKMIADLLDCTDQVPWKMPIN